jgi:hypothetical protein
VAAQRGVEHARRQRRRVDLALLNDRDVGARQRTESRGQGLVERDAERQPTEQLGRALAELDRHRGRLEQPALLDAERSSGREGPILRPERGERAALLVGHHEHVRVHLLAVVDRHLLHGRSVGRDRRLELREVRDQPRALGRRLDQGAVLLLDEARRLRDTALQLRLGLLRHAPRDEEERGGHGQHRDDGRRDEHARAQRGERARHHSTARSCSSSWPASTRSSRRLRTLPSFQSASV